MKPQTPALGSVLLLALASMTVAQTTSTWNLTGDGVWKNAANWDSTDYPDNGQPDPGDTYNAVLNTNRTITLDGSISIQGLTQSTGTITGAADKTLTFAGPLAWSGGILTGGMTVQANGGVSVTNNVNHELNGGTIFNNTGTMNWSQGNIGNNSGTWTFNNTATGVIDVNLTSSPQAFGALSAGKEIHNAGTINIATTTPANYLDFQSPLHNSGLVDITGHYAIIRGGTNTGQIQVASGKTLQFSSSAFTQSGSGSITGAGLVQGVSGGPIHFNAGTTYNVGSTLVHSSDMYFQNAATTGTLSLVNAGRLLGSGSITATGLFTWTGNGGFPAYQTGILESLQINAQGGMLMNGARKHILGGGRVINSGDAEWTSGDLTFKETGGSQGTYLVNAAGGTLDMQFDGQIQAGGTPITNFFTNAGTFTKSGGSGTSLFNVITTNTASGGIHVDSGTLSIWTLQNAGSIAVESGATLAFHDHFTGGTYTQSAGSLVLNGGTVTKPGTNLAIHGGSVTGRGTINGQIGNAGLVRAEGGTLSISNGVIGAAGNLETVVGATLQINGAASSASNLVHSGTSLALASNLTVHGDYQNAAFGTGNAFDPRANVTGAGNILAGGATGQAITGSGVSNGTTATPTLALPTIRQGQSTAATFQVNNPGMTGPLLRGALQTNVNGANITDARLSGSGVTPGDFSVSNNASTADFTVNFTGTSGGPLTGQTLTLRNNFSNVPDQTVTLSGMVWGLAQPQITSTTPIEFGNVRIGKVLPYVPVAIKNNAPADGWHEGLSVAPLFSDLEPEGPGEIVALAPQATDDTTIALRIPTDVVGPVSGQAFLQFESDGTGTSGISPNLNVGEALFDVTGTVYALAAPVLTETMHDFGAVRVGETVAPFVLDISNAAAPYREGLIAQIDPLTVPPGYGVSGSISNLAPGASSTALEITMDTTTSGSRDSTALRVNPASDGVATGEDVLALTPVPITLAGSVWNPAVAQIPGANPLLDLGNFRVGQVAATFIPVKNNAPNDGFSEALAAEINDYEGNREIEMTGGVISLAPQATAPEAFQIWLDQFTAGAFNGWLSLNLVSRNPIGLPDLSLNQQHIDLTASFFRMANGDTPADQILGYVRLGETDSMTGNILVRNVSPNDGFSERLIARITGVGPKLTVVNGETALIDPNSSDLGMSVTMSGLISASRGNQNESVTISYASDGTGTPATSGFAETPNGGITRDFRVRVHEPAGTGLQFASGSSDGVSFQDKDEDLTWLGNFGTPPLHLGPLNLVVRMRNGLGLTSFRDNLKVTFDTGAMGPFTLSIPDPLPTDGLTPGETGEFIITLDPVGLPPGLVTGSLIVQQVSWNPTSEVAVESLVVELRAMIPDPFEAWAANNTLTGDDALPESDPDGDGHTNYAEFAFGSNPLDPKSMPRVIQGFLVDEDGTFATMTVRVRKGDQAPFDTINYFPPFDRPSRAIRDGVSYVAFAATTPDITNDGMDIFLPDELLKIIPHHVINGSDHIPPPSPEYEDVAFRLMASTAAQPKVFFRMKAEPALPPEE